MSSGVMKRGQTQLVRRHDIDPLPHRANQWRLHIEGLHFVDDVTDGVHHLPVGGHMQPGVAVAQSKAGVDAGQAKQFFCVALKTMYAIKYSSVF